MNIERLIRQYEQAITEGDLKYAAKLKRQYTEAVKALYVG